MLYNYFNCYEHYMIATISRITEFFRSVIIITGSGYIKRIGIEEFEAQSRGGKGKMGAKLSTETDSVSQFFVCNDHDSVLFITDR